MSYISAKPATAYEQKVYDTVNKAVASGKYGTVSEATKKLNLSTNAYYTAKAKLKRDGKTKRKYKRSKKQTLIIPEDSPLHPAAVVGGTKHIVIVTEDIQSVMQQVWGQT